MRKTETDSPRQPKPQPKPQPKQRATLTAYFAENRDKILDFGDYFLEKLSDRELLDNLAEKDLEKLARIFKLMFDKSFSGEEKAEKEQNRVLEEILGIFKN